MQLYCKNNFQIQICTPLDIFVRVIKWRHFTIVLRMISQLNNFCSYEKNSNKNIYILEYQTNTVFIKLAEVFYCLRTDFTSFVQGQLPKNNYMTSYS